MEHDVFDKTIQLVPRQQILVYRNIRTIRVKEEDDGLLASIREHGIRQPLLLHRLEPQEDRPEEICFGIDDGHRRFGCSEVLEMPVVPAIVDQRILTAAESLQLQYVSNCHRAELAPMDRARAVRDLIEATGWSQAKIALRLSLSQGNLSRLLALLELPEAIQERVAEGKLGATAAYYIARAGDDATRERLVGEAMQKGRPRRAGVGDANGSRKATGSAASGRVTAALGGGRTVTLAGVGLASLDDLVLWLEQLLARARKVRKGQPKGVELSTFAAMLRDEAKAANVNGGQQAGNGE